MSGYQWARVVALALIVFAAGWIIGNAHGTEQGREECLAAIKQVTAEIRNGRVVLQRRGDAPEDTSTATIYGEKP